MSQKKAICKHYVNFVYYFIILIAAFVFFMSNSRGIVWGATIHIDPTAGPSGDGSFGSPYDSWADVTFSADDDYCQKCGTTWTGALTISATGVSGNHIKIGAYYDDGGATYEWDNPTYGQACGNGAQKPIIQQSSVGTGDVIKTTAGTNQYLELNSLQIKKGQTGVSLNSNHNVVRYCYITDGYWGISVGIPIGSIDGDYNLIEYNYIDLKETVDEGSTNDCIRLHRRAQYNTVQYNVLTGFAHGGVYFYAGSNNTIQYNKIYGSGGGFEDFAIGTNYEADSNIIRYNYCKDAGQALEIMGGSNNEVYGNVFTCNNVTSPQQYQGIVQVQSMNSSVYPSSYNKIYNNVLYDNDRVSSQYGIFLYSNASNNSLVSGNDFSNNIILKVSGYAIRVYDEGNVIGANTFNNNLCYEYNTNQYAQIETSYYSTASEFNSGYEGASDNRDDDPGLSNPANHLFYPDAATDNVVGNGMNLGALFKKILDADLTEFAINPPVVKTVSQPEKWNIGAYALPGVDGFMKPPTITLIKKKD